MGKKYKGNFGSRDFDWWSRDMPGNNQNAPPSEMQLCGESSSGVVFGLSYGASYDGVVGMKQGEDGHIIVIGGSGSGKSVGVAIPTLITWRGALVVTDINGELSEHYLSAYSNGDVTRPPLIFDPANPNSVSYDLFGLLSADDENNLISNIWEIAYCLIPTIPGDNQPFWADSERIILAAALLYFFRLGMSFSETILLVVSKPLSELNNEILHSENESAKLLLGDLSSTKPELLATFEAGLRSKLMIFAADPYISHAFRGKREGAECFSWDDLSTHNIFLRIPEYRIAQWSPAINLIYTQLIRYLERRPNKHSEEGSKNIQTLLLMDELPTFGKLEGITNALSILRCKNVNFCLFVQSLAQLDAIYGENERRIIWDNSPFKVILRANDADTQHYLSELIGTTIVLRRSNSEHQDVACDVDGYSTQESETREYNVFPHELAYLKDALILSPYGFFRAQKVSYDFMSQKRKQTIACVPKTICIEPVAVYEAEPKTVSNAIVIKATAKPICEKNEQPISSQREEIRMLTTEERIAQTKKRSAELAQKDRETHRQEREDMKKADKRRNYIIGELVTQYFPEVKELQPGNSENNAVTFKLLEAFLYVLSKSHSTLDELKGAAVQTASQVPEMEWRISKSGANV